MAWRQRLTLPATHDEMLASPPSIESIDALGIKNRLP
jgi:hypothetical protein